MSVYDTHKEQEVVPAGTPYDPSAWPISLEAHIEDPRWILNGLLAIGEKKPMGFLDDQNFRERGLDPESVIGSLRERGVEIIALERSGIQSKYVGTADLWSTDAEDLREEDFIDIEVHWTTYYGFDPSALRGVLDRNSEVLTEADWPRTPQEFVLRVADEQVPIESPVWRVIAEAFNDPDAIHAYDHSAERR